MMMNQEAYASNILTGTTCFGMLQDDPRWQVAADRNDLILLCDSNTEKLCLPLLRELLFTDSGVPPCITIQAGEESKCFGTIEYLMRALDQHGATRNTILVNLGGGVVSDIGGFAASIFKRGICYVNIPTTLIGQVDAAIGGKTGINVGHAKNQAGTFYFPIRVCIHPLFLETLPETELNSGLGELFKYAMIGASFSLKQLHTLATNTPGALNDIISKCVQYKEFIVTKDPEESGLRKVLNFGHTIGHAIESSFLDMRLPVTHGAAVAAGIIAETYLSCHLNDLSHQLLEEATGFYLDHFQPLPFEGGTEASVLGFIYQDKKNSKGAINPVLLDKDGHPEWNSSVTADDILHGLRYLSSITH
jgi:3-dehydroquinate synthase